MQQRAVFEAMPQPACYPHSVTTLSVRETHISKVFLADPWVYKIKKAVD
jgi:aminoglycoside phosphotransferase family enzyme